MKEFNLVEESNLLIQNLEKKLGGNCVIRLSLDVQLPHQLSGDWNTLTDVVERVCHFLVHNLVNGLVYIEIVKAGQHNGNLTLGVDMKGYDSTRSGVRGLPKVTEAQLSWLNSMPQIVAYTFAYDHLKFSFKVKFDTVKTPSKSLAKNDIKILLAEDNEMNALVFSSFLEAWDIEVAVVENGEEAISKIQKERFDMVLMDIHMPILNGIEATRKIRGFNTKIPIIILTASSLERDLNQAMQAGANDLLQKPVSSSQLQRIVTNYLGPIRQSEKE